MTFNRGDVVLVLYPEPDLRTAKRRPALVIHADGFTDRLPMVIVALISSDPARAGYPSRVALSPDTDDGKSAGLLTQSVIMTDNLATVLERHVDRVLGTLSRPLMHAVDQALRYSLGL